jgi:hypothetical protein
MDYVQDITHGIRTLAVQQDTTISWIRRIESIRVFNWMSLPIEYQWKRRLKRLPTNEDMALQKVLSTVHSSQFTSRSTLFS